jgi:DNA ligase D-like protein (predicted 3'-phosphoesterase)
MSNRGCDGGLSDHRAQRRPDRPGESPGSDRPPAGESRFVVQRHDLSSLHYDLRLEVDGVLASWAVPKGPSSETGDKRLATRTEDHSLGYLDFEGRMPPGEYGGGTVVVWDTGTYRTLADEEVSASLRRGYLKIWLDGGKLSGCYALTQIKLRGDQRHWLLVKVDDEAEDSDRQASRYYERTVPQRYGTDRDGTDRDRTDRNGTDRGGADRGGADRNGSQRVNEAGQSRRESVLSGYANRDS